MAFFDLLSPLFLGIDNFFEPFTSDFVRIALWAFISALVTSLVFKKLSNPDKISALKVTLKAKQKELNDHDGEFSELKGLALETMKLSIKRMGLTFLPAMLASIPIIFVLTHLSNNYGLEHPQVGKNLPISVTWEDKNQISKIIIKTNSNEKIVDNIDSITWPKATETIELLESNNLSIVKFPLEISGIIHKKQWWNSLIGNPAGYINDESQVNRIEFRFKPKKIINIGPSWMHGWLFVFFFLTFAFSIVFLFIFKIKF